MEYKKHGHLTVYCGSMFSGKTTSLLKTVVWNRHVGRTVYVYKPSKDTRYGLDDVVSHDGLSVMAHNIGKHLPFPVVKHPGSLIVIDEIQFFDNTIIEWIIIQLLAGNDVVAVGLDMDYQGAPFETTSLLLAMADEIHKLKAICSVCGSPASKTFKKINNNERVELGSSDLYEARCNNHHWGKKYEFYQRNV